MKRHSPIVASAVAAFFCLAAAGQQPEPVSVGIVLDTSGSMGAKLGVARRFVSEILKSASSLDEFALIQAYDRPSAVSGFVSAGYAVQTIAFLQPKGRSALLDGIYLGVQLAKTGRSARKVLLVISDGDDNSSRYTETEVRNAIREAGVRVYTAGINEPGASPALLVQLAEHAGGRYFGVERASNLPQIALEINSAMRGRP